jgi:hypothetical protein
VATASIKGEKMPQQVLSNQILSGDDTAGIMLLVEKAISNPKKLTRSTRKLVPTDDLVRLRKLTGQIIAFPILGEEIEELTGIEVDADFEKPCDVPCDILAGIVSAKVKQINQQQAIDEAVRLEAERVSLEAPKVAEQPKSVERTSFCCSNANARRNDGTEGKCTAVFVDSQAWFPSVPNMKSELGRRVRIEDLENFAICGRCARRMNKKGAKLFRHSSTMKFMSHSHSGKRNAEKSGADKKAPQITKPHQQQRSSSKKPKEQSRSRRDSSVTTLGDLFADVFKGFQTNEG